MNKRSIVIRNIFCLVIVAALVALDQLTKAAVVANLKGKADFAIIKGVLELQYAENRGAAFGIFQNRQLPITILSLLIAGGLLFLFETTPYKKRMRPALVCYAVIMAGAIGNMIDRIKQSYVVDFIYFKIINFPNFNVADICVTCGCAVLIVLFMFYYKEDDELTVFSKKKAEATVKDTDKEES